MTIINREHNFIFLKSRKTASSSIENFLIKETVLGSDIYSTSRELLDSGLPRHSRQQPVFPGQVRFWYSPSAYDRSLRGRFRGAYRLIPELSQHDSAKKVKRLVGAGFFDNAIKAIPVRNPWDAIVSYYYWDKSGGQGRKESVSISWEDWFESRLKFEEDGDGLCDAQRFLFYEHMFLDQEPLAASYIHFESIQVCLEGLSRQLGLSFPNFDTFGNHLKQGARARDYRGHYSDTQATRVADVFEKYLAVAPYSFDDIGRRPDD